jgi:hypothetical protein
MRIPLLIVFCVGCATTVPYSSHAPCIQPEFVIVPLDESATFVAAAKRAVDRWNDFVGEEVFVFAAAELPYMPGKIKGFTEVRTARDRHLAKWPKPRLAYVDWYMSTLRRCKVGADILVRPSHLTDDRQYYENIIMHELGHVLGLGHFGPYGSVMSKLPESYHHKPTYFADDTKEMLP